MFAKDVMRKNFLILCALVGAPVAAHAFDSVAVEVDGGNKVRAVRIALQSNWERQWWQSNGTHIGGYWDLGLAQWRGNRFQDVPGAHQNLFDIGLTPVFRFERDDKKGAYAEGGIGAHYLSKLYDNNNKELSTRFEFGSHLAVGYVFSNNLDIGLRVQHFSNGGIKSPNDGVNFAGVRASYRF